MQDALFTFNPTAQTINPYDLTFTVRYSMMCVAKLTDGMLNDDYNIGVLPLRRQSAVSLSSFIGFMHHNMQVIINY